MTAVSPTSAGLRTVYFLLEVLYSRCRCRGTCSDFSPNSLALPQHKLCTIHLKPCMFQVVSLM